MGQLTVRKTLADKIKNIKQVCYIYQVEGCDKESISAFLMKLQKNEQNQKGGIIGKFKNLILMEAPTFLEDIIWYHFLLQ